MRFNHIAGSLFGAAATLAILAGCSSSGGLTPQSQGTQAAAGAARVNPTGMLSMLDAYGLRGPVARNPNLIFVGESLVIPADVPVDYKLSDYMPKHAAPVATTTVTASTTSHSHSGNSGGGTVIVQSGKGTGSGNSGGLSGTLSCSGLEDLWDHAGGNPSDAFMAAEIAMAESGGRQYALSPTDDYGYWQINASNGALATFNAYGNARSAIILSDDGTNWDAWTTYREGLYVGKC